MFIVMFMFICMIVLHENINYLNPFSFRAIQITIKKFNLPIICQ